MIKHFLPIWVLFCSFNFAQSQNWTNVDGGFRSQISPWSVSVDKIMYNDYYDALIAFGGFNFAGNVPVSKGKAIYNGVSWDSIPGFENYYVWPGILYHEGNAYFGYNPVMRWNGTNFDTLAYWANGGAASGFTLVNNQFTIYGIFDSLMGQPISGIATWDGNQWNSFGNIRFANGTGIFCAIEYKGEFYIGGNFRSMDGQFNCIARWDGTTWKKVGNGLVGPVISVADFAIYNGDLIVAGAFYEHDGDPGNAIAQWDGNQWLDIGGGMTSYAAGVNDLEIFNNELYALGKFTIAGGSPINNLAKWDGNQWCGLGLPPVTHIGRSMAVYHNELYVACALTFLGDTIRNITKWIGGSYTDTCGAMVGIEKEIPSPKLTLYPNPTHSTFSILGISPGEISGIRVYDVAGREISVMSESGSTSAPPGNQVSLQGWEPGMYFVEIVSREGKQVLKLLVE